MEINKKILGNKIKEIRVNNKMTLEEFASSIREKTDNTQRTGKSNVSKWERGENIPNDITLKAIADIAGINVDELLENQNYINTKKDLIFRLKRDISSLKARINNIEKRIDEREENDLRKVDYTTFLIYEKHTLDTLEKLLKAINNDKYKIYFYQSLDCYTVFVSEPNLIKDLTLNDLPFNEKTMPWNMALIDHHTVSGVETDFIDINNKKDMLHVLKSNFGQNIDISFAYMGEDLQIHSYNEDFYDQIKKYDQIIR